MASTTINIHAPIEGAIVLATTGAPLKLRTAQTGAPTYDQSEVTFFVGDFDLASDLAEAINGVIAKHRSAAQLAEAA